MQLQLRCRARKLALTVLFGWLTLLALPASGGVFDEEARKEVKELRSQLAQKLVEIDNRIQRVEDSVKNLGIIQLLNQLEQLRTDLARLNGQNEIVMNRLDQISKRQQDLYLDLDTRLRKVEVDKKSSPPESKLKL